MLKFSWLRRAPLALALVLLQASLGTAQIQAAEEPPKPYTGFAIVDQPMGENLCAITFDDGPSNFTPHLLDMLDYYGVHATFFMLGRNAAYLPDTVKRVIAEGHEVGNHSYSHPNLKRTSVQRIEDELGRTDGILRNLGADLHFFRPPYGNFNDAVKEVANRLGVRVVIWSHDSLDWKRLPDDYKKLRDPWGREAAPGMMRGVFLFHDIHERTVKDIPRIVSQLKEAGCTRFVTLSDFADGSLFTDQEPAELMTRRPPRTSAQPAASSAPESSAASAVAESSPSVADPRTVPVSSHWSQSRPWGGFAKDRMLVAQSSSPARPALPAVMTSAMPEVAPVAASTPETPASGAPSQSGDAPVSNTVQPSEQVPPTPSSQSAN